jgi:hypothetical protein
MTEFSQARRRLLRNAVAWVSGIAGLAAVKPAGAFETYTVGRNSALGLSYSNHCGPAAEHAGLVAQLQSQLQSDPAAATITQTCPICGCPVTVSR